MQLGMENLHEMRREVSLFASQTLNSIKELFPEALDGKHRRGVLGSWFDDLISGLFGTAKQSDVDQLKTIVSKLAQIGS